MALKAKLTTLEGLDEALHSAYRKEGEIWVLDLGTDDLRDHPSNKGLITALDHERQARKDAEEKAKKDAEAYTGIDDPDEARRLLAEAKENADKKMISEGRVDELVEQRVDAARKDFENQIKAKDASIEELTTSNTALTGEISEIKIFGAVKDAAIAKGARPEALVDISNRARGVWQLKDGKPVALNPDGTSVFGKGGDPVDIPQWIDTMATEAPYLFTPSTGGGAGEGTSALSPFNTEGGSVKRLTPSEAGDNIAALASGEAIIAR